jgi:type IV pilus assembly protein PilN
MGGGIVMGRPNLAARPFENVRPIWVAGGALALAALVLTAVSLGDFVSAHGRERAAAGSLTRLRARRAELATKVEAANRQLAAVGWKKLQGETTSLEDVVARRRLVWSQLLADLERVVPWDIRLVSITPSVAKDGSLQIALDGLATGRDAWLKLIAALFADPRFSDPLPRSKEAPSARNGLGYRFSLTVRYWPEGKL